MGRQKIKIGSLLCVFAVFSLATMFIFVRPVFANWTASGECDFAGFTTIGASETFPNEATCRAYIARGDGICKEKADAAGYSFLSYTTFSLTQDCTGDDQRCQAKYGANIYAEGDRCICDTGYSFLNDACVTQDKACQITYGANMHAENESCVCDAGYTYSGGGCISEDEWCRKTYGNAHAENGKCPCDSGYWFLNGKCVTPDQWCSATHGANSREENGRCISGSQSVQGQTSQSSPALKPSTPPPQTIINKKTSAPPAKKLPPKPPTKDEAARAEIIRALNASKPLNPAAAKIKLKYADEKMLAKRGDLGDPNASDPKILEEVRKLYFDAWLANPRDKKTNIMLAMLEGKLGNDFKAATYEKIAYAVLDNSGQSAISSGIERSMGDILREKEVLRTWREQAAKESSLKNRMKNEINAEMTYAQGVLKEACYKIKPCDQAYAKKVEIMAKAEKLSQKVSDFMDDPIKAVFGVDRKKVKEELYGKK